jgi:hypothetical protein
MTDSTLNRFLASGTNAERLAFTPNPPTPASGPSQSYLWHEEDTGNTYCWNASSSTFIKVNNAPTSTTPNAVTFNNSGSGAASGTEFDGSAAQTISYNTLGAQPSDATLTALSAVAWSAGTQVLTLTAADTFALKTVGIAAGNILDKTAGDTLYQPVGSYQPSDATLTALAGLAWSAGTQVPVFTAADTVSFKTVGSSTGNILDKAAGDSLYQPLDADLTAIAALSGTNTIYYRSAANTWSSVTIGSGLTFSAGTLAASAASITAKEEGTTLTSSLASINWVGAGVTATTSTNDVTVTLNEATAAQVRAGTSGKLVLADVLQSAMAVQTLTDAATVSWDMSTAINAKVTLGGNRTLAVSNPKEGATYSLGVIQDGTGSRTMTWPSSFDWGTTGAPTLTTTASKRDRITVFCTDASTPKFDAFLSGKGFG